MSFSLVYRVSFEIPVFHSESDFGGGNREKTYMKAIPTIPNPTTTILFRGVKPGLELGLVAISGVVFAIGG